MAKPEITEVSRDRYPIIRVTFPNWNDHKQKLMHVFDISDTINEPAEGEFHTDYFTEYEQNRTQQPLWFPLWYSSAKNVIDYALPEITNIWSFGDHTLDEPDLWHVWAQLYANSGFHGTHTHGFGCICACQYIKYDPRVHRSTTFVHMQPNPWTGNTYEISPL